VVWARRYPHRADAHNYVFAAERIFSMGQFVNNRAFGPLRSTRGYPVISFRIGYDVYAKYFDARLGVENWTSLRRPCRYRCRAFLVLNFITLDKKPQRPYVARCGAKSATEASVNWMSEWWYA
jgi:hypothetical protein